MKHYKSILCMAISIMLASQAFAQEVDDQLALIAPSDIEENSVVPEAFSAAATAKSNIVASRLVGCENLTHYCYIVMDMPRQLLDVDGGEIRLIMQHETNPHDQVRTIDVHIGCEWTNDSFGDRGRFAGRYCWARQVGGGEYASILGDNTAHNVFVPWGWTWITDYALHRGNAVLGGNKIQIMAHPHVTTRVFFYD